MYNLSTTVSARTETRGDNTTGSSGTTVTASGTANVKGSWASLGSTTSFDYEKITVIISKSSGNASHLVDIGIQTNSGDRVVCSNIYFPCLPHASLPPISLTIPIHIPSGSQIRARSQSSTASATCSVMVIGSSRGIGRAPGYPYMDNLVASATAGSFGFILDPSSAPDTKSTWRTVTSSVTRPVSELLVMVGGATDISRAAAVSGLLDIGYGTATNCLKISNLMVSYETLADGWQPPILGLFPADISSSSIVSARFQATATTAGDRVIDVMLYGLGGA